MNPLTDREILELNELCNAVVDGTLTAAQKARLGRWLGESEEARRYYVRTLGLSASLYGYASEMQAEAPDAARSGRGFRSIWQWGALAAAAGVALGLWYAWPAPRVEGAPTPASKQQVAMLTGAKECLWAPGTPAVPLGTRLYKGQRLELAGGLAEITFDSGASVVLEGPALLVVNSAWDTALRRGALKASVPPEAIGFRITNHAVEVVDLGTEFTMIADGRGAAEVLVLKGEVEAAPRSVDQDTILLREKESRRFADSGVSDVSDRERKFALFAPPLSLARFAPRSNYVHWSFDESAGDVVQADFAGTPLAAFDAHLTAATGAALATSRTEGHRAHALRFDGQFYAKAKFPGISGSSPRTVAFWVKVPEDAVTDAWMVSWGTDLLKLNHRPVQISWNRRPAEGALGALRTDFGGGHAIGTTSLRDGRWHHVAVYFAPGEDSAAPVQVKQYVDGRLESSTIILDVVRAPAGTGDGAIKDTVWLGCRLTGHKQQERFRGEMDELFIADRGLEPHEIVQLMQDNRLTPAVLVAAHASGEAQP